MHVQNRKAKSVKQRRREKRNTSYRLYLLFLHLFLSVYVCCQASAECQSYPLCTLRHSTSFPSSIVPLDVGQSLLKPASLRLLAIQKRPSFSSLIRPTKKVSRKGRKRKEKKRQCSQPSPNLLSPVSPHNIHPLVPTFCHCGQVRLRICFALTNPQ